MVKALAASCHPGPSAAVTSITTALAWRLGWSSWELLFVAVTVLLGQLSIGWSNDAHDARIDAASLRTDKPAGRGEIARRTLWISATVALIASCLMSWAVAGLLGGTLHVIAVLAGWLYNVVLSRTAFAWLPYAIAFPLLPAFLSVGLGLGLPPAWLPITFGLIGLAAHLTNSLRDLDRDAQSRVGGTAQRLGPTVTLGLATLLLGAATALLASLVAVTQVAAAVSLIAAFAVAVVIGIASGRHLMFRIVLIVALVDAAIVLVVV